MVVVASLVGRACSVMKLVLRENMANTVSKSACVRMEVSVTPLLGLVVVLLE